MSFFLLQMGAEFYEVFFLHLLRCSCGFSFLLLMWYITLIDLPMLSHACDPGIIHLDHDDPFDFCGFGLLLFVKDFFICIY